jgi:acetolactate synthase small subunit
VTVEVAGNRERIDMVAGIMRPFGIKEIVRTGLIAMSRAAPN